jgi:hypothetical protein
MKTPTGLGHPLHKDAWKPVFGIPYKVSDLETWGSVARDVYNRDGGNSDTSYYDHDYQARFLIDYNFRTENPAYVNWYLHHYVGCNQPSHDGYNWKFSSKDKPGIIYLPPPTKLKMPGIAQIMLPNSSLAQALEDAEHNHIIIERIHLAIDAAEFVHIGLAMVPVEVGIASGEFAGPTAGGLAFELSGPAIGLVLTGMALGVGTMEAIDEIKTNNAVLGISHGVVLGAAAESWPFLNTYFVRSSIGRNTYYPDEQENFQAAYVWGLTHGYAYGAQLDGHQRYLFFKHLDSRSGYRPFGHFYLTRGARSEMARNGYYKDCAQEFVNELDFVGE